MKESQHTEWKESWRDEYLRWVCGFANAEGGVLVIGKSDTKVETSEKTREKLLRLVREAPDISTNRIAAELGMTRKGVEWQIKQLKVVGFLIRVGAAKGGRWEVIE